MYDPHAQALKCPQDLQQWQPTVTYARGIKAEQTQLYQIMQVWL